MQNFIEHNILETGCILQAGSLIYAVGGNIVKST